jgi:Tol biopolymer transport system component
MRSKLTSGIACWLLAAAAMATSDEPQIFSPGVISGPAHDSAPAFTPDGKTVYFGRGNNDADFILVSNLAHARWSEPIIAPFSGRWLDMEPAMSPDGSHLVFVSNRPVTPGGQPIDGAIGGQSQPRKGANLWRVDRSDKGWSEPIRLPDNINSSNSTYAPSVAANGDIYFMRPDGAKSRFRIFMAKRASEGYENPVPVSFSDGRDTDVDPAIAPDQSFIVFGSSRHAKKDIDLFIAFRRGGRWGDPLYLGDKVNSPTSDAEPRLGPDNHTLYFSSERLAPTPQPIPEDQRAKILREIAWNNGLYNIWMIDLAPWLTQRSNLDSAPVGLSRP